MGGVVGIGQRQVSLGCDVRAGQPADALPEAGCEPLACHGIVPVLVGGAEQWAVSDIVHGAREDECIVCVIGAGKVSGL